VIGYRGKIAGRHRGYQAWAW